MKKLTKALDLILQIGMISSILGTMACAYAGNFTLVIVNQLFTLVFTGQLLLLKIANLEKKAK